MRVQLAALCFFLSSVFAGLQGCSGATSAVSIPSTTPPSQWIIAWGASSQNALPSAANPGGSEQSFRFLVLPSVAATKERIHLSNQFGTSTITVGATRIGVAISGVSSSVAEQDTAVTFNGSSSVSIPAGQEVDSDPVNVTYTFGQWLAVSIYLEGSFPALTQHNSQVSNNYATTVGVGDKTMDSSGASFSVVNQEWFLLSAVEAYGPYSGTVAFFGSSSVDGHNSNFGSGNSYPVPNIADPALINDRPTDWLARSLNSAGYAIGVANAGLLGDPAGEDTSTQAGNVLAGVDRFKHDVLDLPGIKTAIVYIGGVDLRGDCLPATTVEGSLTNIVEQAETAGVRVILTTIPPSEYCLSAGPQPTAADPYNGDLYPGPENSGSTERRAVNTWIRGTGAQLPGVVAIADFDQALAYPAHPDFYMPSLYSNDNFHPNAAGYGIQNRAIPLNAIMGN